jgi:GTPase involved in cell partitioning and DNA repair
MPFAVLICKILMTIAPFVNHNALMHIGSDNKGAVVLCLFAGSKALLAAGGRGGRGNASFKTHRNNAPALAERGEKGNGSWLELELQLVADVGIVRVPNAGKSTLLSVVRSFPLLLPAHY